MIYKSTSHKTRQSLGVMLDCAGIRKPDVGLFFLALNEQLKCEPNSKCAVIFISVECSYA